MKYILNRSTGKYSKGQLFDQDLNLPVSNEIFDIWLELGWLDEVKEEKSVWDLKINDEETYFRINTAGDIDESTFDSKFDEDVRATGNIFLTRESAERELEIRKTRAKEAREGLGLK